RSSSRTAASFVRPSRPADPRRGFLEALRGKYVSDETSSEQPRLPGQAGVAEPIVFNGKVAQEIGFDKIRRRLAAVQELKVVLLDGLQVAGVLAGAGGDEAAAATGEEYAAALREIEQSVPAITELDLSCNLLESWRQVDDICGCLPRLRSLRLIGNRFNGPAHLSKTAHVTELCLDETLLSWEELSSVLSGFPALRKLTFSSNGLVGVSELALPRTIEELRLDYNEIETLDSLRPLTQLPSLTRLSLRGNNIHIPQQPSPRLPHNIDLRRPVV
ncbi:hypothetical protein KEM52_003328, partial [Ascosphaera acerosa]